MRAHAHPMNRPLSVTLRHLPAQLLALLVQLRDLRVQPFRLHNAQIVFVQLQRGARVLHRVVRLRLDANAEEVPGEEAQRDHALVWQVEQVHGVDHLVGGHDDVDDAENKTKCITFGAPLCDARNSLPEVVLQAVPDKDDAHIGQIAQLLVAVLQCGQVLLAEIRVQVARLDARELGQIVDDLLLRGDVVIDERHTLVRSLAEKRTYAMAELEPSEQTTPNCAVTHPRMHVMRATLM